MRNKISVLKKKVFALGLASAMITCVSLPVAANKIYADETMTKDITDVTEEEAVKTASEVRKTDDTDESREVIKNNTEHDDNKKDSTKAKDSKKNASQKAKIKHGWIKENGELRYYGEDGLPYTGWHEMGEAEGESVKHWSYFGKDGVIYTGWHEMGKAEGESVKHWSYFGGNGWLRTGWQEMGRGTGNSFGEKSSKHWSYFGGNGWLQTGWKEFTKADGENTPHWSFFGNNGWLRTGLQTMETRANPDGKNKQHLSYFGGNGWLVENALFNHNNAQYIADSKGWATAVKSDYDKTLARAYQLVSKVTNDSMSKEQQLRACFNHIRDKYPYRTPRIPHYSGQGWHITYANDIFVGKGGNCFSCGAAFAFMAKAIGYDNVYAVNVSGHGWAEINGLIYDPDSERWHKGSYFGLSYSKPVGTQDLMDKFKLLSSAKGAFAKVRI